MTGKQYTIINDASIIYNHYYKQNKNFSYLEIAMKMKLKNYKTSSTTSKSTKSKKNKRAIMLFFLIKKTATYSGYSLTYG